MMNVESRIRKITISDSGLDLLKDNPYIEDRVVNKYRDNIQFFRPKGHTNIEVEVTTETPTLPSILLQFNDEDTLLQRIFNIVLIESKNAEATYQIQDYINSGGTVENVFGIVNTLGLKKVNLYKSLESEVDEDLETQIFRANFQYSDLPSDLSFILLTYLDFSSIEAEFKIKIPDAIKSQYITQSLYNVVNEGEVVDSFYSFLDQNQEYYTGPVEFSDGVYYKLNTKEILEEQEEFNDVIVDQRSFKKSFEIDSYLEEKSLYSEDFKKSLVYHPAVYDYEKKKVYADVMLTYDSDNTIRGAITLDFFNIIRDNGRFGFTLKDKSSTYDAISESKIKSFILYRQRVEPIRVLNDLSTPVNKWNSMDYPLEIVCSGNDKSKMFFPEFTRLDNNGRQIGTLKELNSSTYYRQFVFSDDMMKDITDGNYQYFIKLVVMDGTLEKLKNDISMLTRTYKKFQFYKNELSSAVYKKKFYTRMVNSDKMLWNEIPIELIDTISLYYDIKDPKIVEDLIKLIHPLTATDESVYEFESIFSNMLEELTNMNQAAKYLDDIQIEITLSEVVDSNIVRGAGLDYLFDLKQEDFKFQVNGLVVLDATYYISRANTEADGYYNILEDRDQLTAFLTPSRVIDGRNKVLLGSKESYSKARSVTAKNKRGQTTEIKGPENKKTTERIENINLGVNNSKETNTEELADSSRKVSSVLKLNVPSRTKVTETNNVYKNIKKLKDNNFVANNIPDDTNIPYQIKSLLKAVDGDTNVKPNSIVDPSAKNFKGIDNLNQDEFKFNYELISKIEYLSGFVDDDIKNPTWELLTFDKFNRLEGETICRLSPIDYPFINLNGREEFSDTPIINKYFLLRSGVKIQSSEIDYKSKFLSYTNEKDKRNLTTKKNNGIFRIR